MKRTRTLVAVAVIALTIAFLSSCKETGTGNIPIDKKRAQKHLISLKTADTYRSDFAKTKDALRSQTKDSSFLDREFDMPIAEAFNRDAIALLLNQPGADGVRIYLGRDDKGKIRLVLLPVDKNGKDIRRKLLESITDKAAAQLDPEGDGDGEGGAVEVGQRCPDLCD